VGEDRRDVGRIMLKIRRRGAAVSSIEIALWDIAGEAAGLPVYELLGGEDSVFARMGTPKIIRPCFLRVRADGRGVSRISVNLRSRLKN